MKVGNDRAQKMIWEDVVQAFSLAVEETKARKWLKLLDRKFPQARTYTRFFLNWQLDAI
jgi:hypothetical protein